MIKEMETLTRLFSTTFIVVVSLLISILCCVGLHASPENIKPNAILQSTGLNGGLCLIIGDDSLTLGKDLAENSGLYVQILQADSKKAFRWGLDLAKSPQREQLGIRLSAFDPDEYGSQLFNLLIVNGKAVPAETTLKDLHRLLVPHGTLLMKKMPASFAKPAKQLGMKKGNVAGWDALRRGDLQEKWEIVDSLKWRAGARAQWSVGWKGLSFGAGKFLYCERLEVPNDGAGARKMLFVRDAFNGRALWNMDLGYDNDRRGGTTPIAISDNDRVLTVAKTQDVSTVIGLDGRTGKLLFELPPAGNPAADKVQSITYADGTFFVYGAGWVKVVDTNGKLLWTKRWGLRNLFKDGIVYNYDGRRLLAAKAGTGDPVWNLELKASWPYPIFLTDDHVHIKNKNDLYSVAMADGKLAPNYEHKLIPPYRNRYRVVKGEIYDLWYYPYPKDGKSDLYWSKIDHRTGKRTGTVRESGTAYTGNMCAPHVFGLGDKLVYFFNVWIDPKTSERSFTYLAHPSCSIGTRFENNLSYNVPSRKAGPLHGISATGPADIRFDHEPGGKILETFSSQVTSTTAVKTTDWPLFRNNPARGNAAESTLGSDLKVAWEADIGLGGRSFGEMHEQRLGLTQPVSAWGLVIVADITAQRIVALDSDTGKQKWVFHPGSRVDLSPTLYNGMCLFTSKDGWVWCLDAQTGKARWRLLLPPKERLIGGQDKLESLWPMVSDVMISKAGIGYVACGIDTRSLGGIRALAFKPETGEVIWTQCYSGSKGKNVYWYLGPDIFIQDARPEYVFMGDAQLNADTGELLNPRGRKQGPALSCPTMDNWLAGGISVPRNAEDRGPVKLSSGVAKGKTLAFNSGLSVAYTMGRGAEGWAYAGKLPFFAKRTGEKDVAWGDDTNELVMDDIVLTKEYAYVVGYYYRIPGKPELRVINTTDGKLVKKYQLDGYASWNGMSIADKKLFIATRSGKLICYKGT